MKVTAPAKVNLALHVTGKRADGYHLLDSLVVFARYGDELLFEAADEVALEVKGAFAEGVPTGPENLILRAYAAFGRTKGLRVLLEKNLPHAAGIGGGSSDAAAVLRYGARMGWEMPSPREVLALGADVPVCVGARPARMGGIGETLEDVPFVPPLPMVLVNPGVPVPTGPVVQAMASVDNAPRTECVWETPEAFLDWLGSQRNVLEAPAMGLVPEIGACLDALRAQEGCGLARMSGSGGTCFGLFPRAEDARQAAEAIAEAQPGWWCVATVIDGEGGL